MSRAIPDEKRLKKSLDDLEMEYKEGNLSKEDYFKQKEELSKHIETLAVADRVRRLQGRMGSQRPLEYWSEKENEKKEKKENKKREELIKKYVTTPLTLEGKPMKERLGTRAKVLLSVFLVAAFVVGTVLGVSLISNPSETPQVLMTVDASAFPANNATNTTNTTTQISTTDTTSTTTTVDTTPVETTTTTPVTTPETPPKTNSSG
jgi:hypothetical protein